MGAEHCGESEFPAGLRVLVVDDDRICLLILDRLLRECLYRVTTCERAADALKLLRDNKDGFDVVISDVHMPDMDGYKLLELVVLEMDLPVLMMSSNSETSAVMKGIKHGACDYLLKPVRIEELKNIWQHVIRRRKKELEVDERRKTDDGADLFPNDAADGASKALKKRKDNVEDDDDLEPESDDPATSKKPRVVWSEDLHRKFVNAVSILGIEKAVPKRILELMDVKGLTRENVASHLQKYRLYLKRLSGVPYQSSAFVAGSLFGGADDRFWPTGAALMGDYRPQLPVHSLIFDRVIPSTVDPGFLGQFTTIQGIDTSLSGKPQFRLPSLNSANDPSCPALNAIDVKVVSQGVGGQVHNDTLYKSPLAANTEQPVGQEHRTLADHKKKALLVHILQQQHSGVQMALPDVQRSNTQNADTCSSLINESLNALNSTCRPHPEMGMLCNLSYEPSTMLGPFRKKGMEVRPQNNIPDAGFAQYTSSSSLASQSIPYAIELPNKDKPSGLQAILSNEAVGNTPFRPGTSIPTTCKAWNRGEDLGSQAAVCLPPSNHCQGSTLSQASKLSCVQDTTLGWIPNFQFDPLEVMDVKPLATGMIPALEQEFGGRDVPKAATSDLLLGHKMGTAIPESFASANDLLTAYIKQQQHNIESVAEGNAEDGYAIGNMFVK